MKNILFILLFFTCTAKAQIVINFGASAASTSGTAGFTPFDYDANTLYIMFIGQTDAGSPPPTPTVTGTSQTWTQITTVTGVTTGTPLARLTAFRFLPSSAVTGVTTFINLGGDNGAYYYMFKITGCDLTGTNGSNAIVQSPTASADATANPVVTMSALTGGINAVVAAFINSANPFGGTPESGWTEDFDNGYNTPTTGAYTMHRLTTTDNTPTVTAASSDWAGIAIEIKSAARRRIIID